ncbi:dynein axonemal heavy chain 5-like [Bacillus rossius redtenbacheri]|uniref:dynein axonemal heavy chain 5-like n=1 Tax=Bacillus rossius redtenbacheri TaxID=93214 RepID=UPI002FDCC0CC
MFVLGPHLVERGDDDPSSSSDEETGDVLQLKIVGRIQTDPVCVTCLKSDSLQKECLPFSQHHTRQRVLAAGAASTWSEADGGVSSLLQKRREECERKARRGEMDPRLEFTFQLLLDATGLPRSDLMDYVFEGNMLDEINQLFLPHMRDKLMWFYQEVEESAALPQVETAKPGAGRGAQTAAPRTAAPAAASAPKKKQLFLTDGWQVPLTGLCVYIFRLNTGKQLPEEGFHKDLYCGVLDAAHVGLVTSVERVMDHVFMEALAHPAADCEDDDAGNPTIKNQLLPGLRSFCSALKVCEEVCDQPNLFEDGLTPMADVSSLDDVRDYVKMPSTAFQLEERVKAWIRRVQEVIMESQQLRRENDASGPQDELEYWKKRGAQFSQIVSNLQNHEVQMTLMCLQVSRSRLLKQWRETDRQITFCYNEARDNAKFIQSMERCCHALYLHDPVKMKDSIMSLLQTVRLIHSVSQYYNTSERTSSLMVKITNQMIESCKQYVTCRGKETARSQILHCDCRITNQMIESCKQYVTCRGKETARSQILHCDCRVCRSRTR